MYMYIYMHVPVQARVDGFHAYKSREVPVRKRDVSSLKDMFSQLQELAAKKKKGSIVPKEMTFELLEGEWEGLQRENEKCEVAMTREFERLMMYMYMYMYIHCTWNVTLLHTIHVYSKEVMITQIQSHAGCCCLYNFFFLLSFLSLSLSSPSSLQTAATGGGGWLSPHSVLHTL